MNLVDALSEATKTVTGSRQPKKSSKREDK